MYGLATCTVTVIRTLGDNRNEFGTKVPIDTVIATGVIASIQETNSTLFDAATQTPRVVRRITGTMPVTVDVQVGDRVRDDRYQVAYWVDNVTLRRAPGHQPDLEVDLRRVN